MKGFIKNTLIGILIGILSLIFTDWYGAVITGFIAAIILNVVFVAQVWIRELFRQERYLTITIWKGFHRPFPWFTFKPFIIRNKPFEMHKPIRFTKDSIYDNDDGKYSINKLFGFTTGHPHKNSWRWGWSINRYGELSLHTYSYKDGERTTAVTIPIETNKTYHLFIAYRNGKIIYKCDDVIHTEFVKLPKYGIGWGLGVYFGGKLKAPKTIKLLTY